MPRILTRRRAVTGAALAGLVLAALVLWARAGSDPAPDGLGTHTVPAGEVEVRMTALVLDPTGARFRIALETHTVELDVDLAESAQLRVNGEPAGAGTWSGNGPGGHHRSGTLSFTAAVPPGAAVELLITGLPEDAVGTWTAP